MEGKLLMDAHEPERSQLEVELTVKWCTKFLGWMKRFGYALNLFRSP